MRNQIFVKSCYLLFLFFTLTISLKSFAQGKRVYFNDDNERVSQAKASSYIEFGRRVNGVYPYKRFSLKGIVQEEGNSSSNDAIIRQAEIRFFYLSGKIKAIEEYAEGVSNGLVTGYYESGKVNYKLSIIQNKMALAEPKPVEYLYCESPDEKIIMDKGNGYFQKYDDSLHLVEEGQVKDKFAEGEWKGLDRKMRYKDDYKNGILLKGESIDSTGKKYLYQKIFVPPLAIGGPPAIAEFIRQNYGTYVDIKKLGVHGKIIVSFVVDTDGSTKNVKLVSGIHPVADAEAVRVIELFPKWIPGMFRGTPVKTNYIQPLNL